MQQIGGKLFEKITNKIDAFKSETVNFTGAGESIAGFLTARLIDSPRNAFLIITKDQDSAERTAHTVERLSKISIPGQKVHTCLYSSLEWTPYEFLSPSMNLLSDRIAALQAIMEFKNEKRAYDKLVIVAPIAALIQKTAPSKYLEKVNFKIKKGMDLPLERLISQLAGLNYSMEDPVIDLAQYALRGGILDIFVPGYHYPFRLDFFGDTIESIKTFNVDDQRALNDIDEFSILPASEFVFFKEDVERLFTNLNKIAKVGTSSEINEIREGIKIANIEKYMPYMYDFKMPTIADYFHKYAPEHDVIFIGKDDIFSEYADYTKKLEKLFEEANGEDTYTLAPSEYFADINTIYDGLIAKDNVRVVNFTPYDISDADSGSGITFDMNCGSFPRFHGKFGIFIEQVKTLLESGNTVIMVLPSAGQISRMAEIISNLKFPVLTGDNFFKNPIAKKAVYLNEGYLNEGFIVPSEKLAVFSSYEAYGERQVLFTKEAVLETKSKAKSKYKQIASHLELNEGDYVVHVNYGIGIYRGITLLSSSGRESDYLLIEYADSDKLYVPVDALQMLHKYASVDGVTPRIGKLNDSSWKKQKAHAQKSIEKLAAYLVTLYARRAISPGYKFGADNELMEQFESSFQYKETIDQQNAILDVKCDMESEKPMDRLICGDVGFGKTEVAIRAAFKACMDNKQVAFLAPTTILAMQHFNNLTSRFATYPLRVELMSRFRTKSEQKKTVERLKEGKVDVLIGTHRIIQDDIDFKDLGLLIVDEEQRFGVKHKERLKEIKHQVDVLTLSATPIPRTLYMSLVGCRDISVINTPPAERLPIKTFVLKYSEEVLKEAINRELLRHGQVYYLHNRIESIDAVCNKIAALIPGARVRYAHGQMEEKQLEKIMIDFYDREFDILVSTTIIENGLDISNVNTIIIERADTFGLSQLYQLRGRVGRAKNQAYAYFLFPHETSLTDVAKRRLQAIKEFSDLGSGYKIAMRDMEIRGAGNLLGNDQHGHICNIGFELYCRLLEDEIKRIKGEAIENKVDYDCEIEININAYIPTNYISSTYQKIDVYKRMVGASSFEELTDIAEELKDRFGKYPEVVQNLFSVVKLKICGRAIKALAIKEEKKHIMMRLANDAQIPETSLAILIKKYGKNISFADSEGASTLIYVQKQDLKGENLIHMLINILQILKGE